MRPQITFESSIIQIVVLLHCASRKGITFQERNMCMKSTKEYIELLKEFKNKEAGHYAISRIGIFGSVARGEQTEESDVDVYVECPPMGLFRLGSLKNTLEQLFGCRVDIVRLRDHMNAFLRERIEKEGIYV